MNGHRRRPVLPEVSAAPDAGLPRSRRPGPHGLSGGRIVVRRSEPGGRDRGQSRGVGACMHFGGGILPTRKDRSNGTYTSPHDIEDQPRDTSSALSRALLVLEKILESEGSLGMQELCLRLKLPRQTAHRIVNQLLEHRMLQRESARDQFTPGPLLRRLALATILESHRNGPRHSLLTRLAEETGETCYIGVLDQDRVLIVDRVESRYALRVHSDIGRRLEPHSSGIGKLLLAFLPRPRRMGILDTGAPLTRYTPFTLVGLDELEEEFARIRKRGFAVSNQGATLGMYSIAVPIRDHRGRIAAGIGCHAPLVRLDEDRAVEEVLPRLVDAAQRLEAIHRSEAEACARETTAEAGGRGRPGMRQAKPEGDDARP